MLLGVPAQSCAQHLACLRMCLPCCSYVLTAARQIAPVIDRSGAVAGFDWCLEALTSAQHSGLASEVALAKAAWFLDHQAFGDAVTVLKV